MVSQRRRNPNQTDPYAGDRRFTEQKKKARIREKKEKIIGLVENKIFYFTKQNRPDMAKILEQFIKKIPASLSNARGFLAQEALKLLLLNNKKFNSAFNKSCISSELKKIEDEKSIFRKDITTEREKSLRQELEQIKQFSQHTKPNKDANSNPRTKYLSSLEIEFNNFVNEILLLTR